MILQNYLRIYLRDIAHDEFVFIVHQDVVRDTRSSLPCVLGTMTVKDPLSFTLHSLNLGMGTMYRFLGGSEVGAKGPKQLVNIYVLVCGTFKKSYF